MRRWVKYIYINKNIKKMDNCSKPGPGFPIIRTKLTIPNVQRNIVHRRELFNQIDEGINQGFILVSTPPGYGKTTLLADWAKHNGKTIAWLTLEESDNDLLTFNRYLRVITNQNFSGLQFPSDKISLESDAEDNLNYLIATIINGCLEREKEFTLILDDYQFIQNPLIHNAIIYLLDHFPPHFRLIIASRIDPPFPLSRLIANQRLLSLNSIELKFTFADIKAFINQTLKIDLSESQINKIYQQTEGWIAGLQLAILSRNQLDGYLLSGSTISHNATLIKDYIIEEILNEQSPQVKEFLILTSVLENLTGPLCNYVLNTGNRKFNSGELLHTIYHSNLFLTTLDVDEQWYRYHPLFAEALRHLLFEQYPNEKEALLTRASEWCNQNGLFEEALTYAQHSNDALYLSLLEDYSINAIKSGEIMELYSWIRRTNDELLIQSPLLCLMYSWGLLMSFEVDSGEIWMERACNILDNHNIDPTLFPFENELWGLIYEIQSILAAVRGNNSSAIELSKKAINLLPEENSFTYSMAVLSQGVTYSLNGELDKAITVLKETIHNSQKTGNWITFLISHITLGGLYIDKGQQSQALILFQQTQNFISTHNTTITGLNGFLYKGMADIYLSRNQLAEGSKYLRKGIEINQNWLPALNELDSHLRLARLYHYQGDYQSSQKEMDCARNISDISEGQLDDLIIDIQDGKLSLLRGQTSQAQNWFQKNGLNDENFSEFISEFPPAVSFSTQLLLARLFLVQGRQNDDQDKFFLAINILHSVIPRFIETGYIEYLIESYVLLALTFFELEQIDEMLSTLKEAFTLAEPEEMRQVFIDEDIPMARMLSTYLTYLKQNKVTEGYPTRSFISDLLFRLSDKRVKGTNVEIVVNDICIPENDILELLTPRELEIMSRVAVGQTNKEIAQDFYISINTVKRHLNNIFSKLGVDTRTQAVAVARNRNLIQ